MIQKICHIVVEKNKLTSSTDEKKKYSELCSARKKEK